MQRLTEALEQANTNLDFSHLALSPTLPQRLVKKLFYFFCKCLFKIYCPMTVTGIEHLPKEPFIFCSNHCSHMDSTALMIASRLPFSRFVMLAAKDYFFEKNASKSSFNLLDLVPISRKSTPKALIYNILLCKNLTQEKNRNLIIYPEGTRSISGEMGSFKRGPALFAAELNLPIVPVYIQGTYQALPKGCVFPRPHRIKVNIGAPIDPVVYQATFKKDTFSAKELYDALTRELHLRIQSLKSFADHPLSLSASKLK